MQELSDDLLEGAQGAAAFLKLRGGPRAVYRMTEAGHLPVIRKGRRLFYRKSDLTKAFSAEAA
ncbi:helix-turn-helix domain-containing protein [Sphingomonas asaccharolytica]|uniref:helix-turn-helix domain-containing protein n=1 Tax=Sphingomonas asaccharolytica TaxID=40681 RepID=UPI000832B4C1|nr:helix-turn-helix domain-containing protein [Sphingomonas asaccharolytica]